MINNQCSTLVGVPTDRNAIIFMMLVGEDTDQGEALKKSSIIDVQRSMFKWRSCSTRALSVEHRTLNIFILTITNAFD